MGTPFASPWECRLDLHELLGQLCECTIEHGLHPSHQLILRLDHICSFASSEFDLAEH